MKHLLTIQPAMQFMDVVKLLVPILVELCYKSDATSTGLGLVVPIPEDGTPIHGFIIMARRRQRPVLVRIEVVNGKVVMVEHVVPMVPSVN